MIVLLLPTGKDNHKAQFPDWNTIFVFILNKMLPMQVIQEVLSRGHSIQRWHIEFSTSSSSSVT